MARQRLYGHEFGILEIEERDNGGDAVDLFEIFHSINDCFRFYILCQWSLNWFKHQFYAPDAIGYH